LPGKDPIRRELDLGFAATVTRHDYVYWSKGALWSVARSGKTSAKPRLLVPVPEQPQRVVSDIGGDELAWLEHSRDGHHAIVTMASSRAQRLYVSREPIDALMLLGDTVFFVERPSGEQWRIGRVSRSGEAPSFTAARPGRWPALLGGRHDVVYYDGNRRAVIALTRDLQQERTLGADVICSPLAAAANVYCANPDGIVELKAGQAPRRVTERSRYLVAGLATFGERLALLSDVARAGQDQLAVSVVTPSAAVP
jgi:hypothetical protein